MATKRVKRNLNTNRFDGEVLGLVLFAVGIFLGITVALPVSGAGFMSRANGALSGSLGWASTLLPLIPACYGVLVFLGRDLNRLTRRVLGGVLVTASVLALQELFWPGTAGQLAELAMQPLFGAISYAAALIPLVTLTLGLEIMFAWAPTTLLRRFFMGVSLLLAGSASAAQGALEARQEGRDAARLRHHLRQGVAAHIRDLEALRKLYPDARELSGWQDEARKTSRTLGTLNETELKATEKQLKGWRDVSASFVSSAARELLDAVKAEAPEAAAQAEALAKDQKAGRSDLSAELPSTMASGALERLRRAMVMDLQRLAHRAGTLEQLRKRSEQALNKADAAVLLRERPAHQARLKDWQELQTRFLEWRTRAELYPGWPDRTARFDRAPAELAAELSEALGRDAEETLRAGAHWDLRLEQELAAQASRAAAEAQASVTAPSEAEKTDDAPPVITEPPVQTEPLPALDFSFDEPSAAPEPAVLVVSPAAPVNVTVPVTPPTPVAVTPSMPVPLPTEPVSVPAAPDRMVISAAPVADLPLDDLPVPSGRKLAETPPWEDDDALAPEKPAPKPSVGAIDIAIPGLDLLDPVPALPMGLAQLDAQARMRAELINQTLAQFGLSARVVDFARGPTVTRYEIEPAPGEKISRIAGLSNDLARALAVGGVRVEAPVPGKSVIGLEVPNTDREPVTFHTAVAAPSFQQTRARLPIILGKSIDGDLMVGDLAKMPHLLIAGSTGSGKSVCVNTLITSLLYRYLPTELRFLMVDPKMVELTPYDGIPHLVRGVVTNPMDAAGVLLGAVAHMERRYKMMSQIGAKNLEQFNAKMRQVGEPELPHLVIIIDELADLMITSPKEVESAIMRLAQMARATGMHLVLATQRPSVDILTSLIKVNVPARIAFAVSSSHDSRTILDAMGAERLTGMGDMLFYQPGLVKPLRLQGPYISELESQRISDFLRRQVFEDWFVEAYGSDFDGAVEAGAGSTPERANMDFSDPYLRQAAQICIEEGQGSVSRLQRRLSVGHARAGKLMDMLEAMGIVSKHQGSKPRDVLISEADLPEYFGR